MTAEDEHAMRKSKKCQMAKQLGLQEHAQCRTKFMREVQNHGIHRIRMRSDLNTNRDSKIVLIVWTFQAILCVLVVYNQLIPFEDIIDTQL